MPPRKFNRIIPKALGKGVLDFDFADGVTSHNNTWRLIFVGPSNSGKTTACFNTIRDFPKPINSITYIAPASSHDDEGPLKFRDICEQSKIIWTGIFADGKATIEIPNAPKPEIVIFDDCWKYKKIEPLIEQVFIRGRHDQRHGVFMAQTPAFIPNACRNNFTYAFIHKDFFNDDTEKKFHFDPGALTKLTPSDDNTFIIIQTGGNVIGWYHPHRYFHKHQVITVMKAMPSRKTVKKIDPEKEHIIKRGIVEAGNHNVKDFPILEVDWFWKNQMRHFR